MKPAPLCAWCVKRRVVRDASGRYPKHCSTRCANLGRSRRMMEHRRRKAEEARRMELRAAPPAEDPRG